MNCEQLALSRGLDQFLTLVLGKFASSALAARLFCRWSATDKQREAPSSVDGLPRKPHRTAVSQIPRLLAGIFIIGNTYAFQKPRRCVDESMAVEA